MDLKAIGKGLGGVALGVVCAGFGAVSTMIGIKCCTESLDDIFDSFDNEDDVDDVDEIESEEED